MDDPTPEQYRDFLTSTWCDTSLFEYTPGESVVAVSVIDRLADAVSCVYTFLDPVHVQSRRSPGTYAILHAIEVTRRHSLEWLYLGYYVADSPKMRCESGPSPTGTVRRRPLKGDRTRLPTAGVRMYATRR